MSTKAAWNAKIRNYKNAARSRGFSWDLAREEALSLFKGRCEYCGSQPNKHFNPYTNSQRISEDTKNQSWIMFNGIDRLDNQKGYFLLNCVSCCWQCNKSKGTMSLSEFETWIERMVEFRSE